MMPDKLELTPPQKDSSGYISRCWTTVSSLWWTTVEEIFLLYAPLAPLINTVLENVLMIAT